MVEFFSVVNDAIDFVVKYNSLGALFLIVVVASIAIIKAIFGSKTKEENRKAKSSTKKDQPKSVDTEQVINTNSDFKTADGTTKLVGTKIIDKRLIEIDESKNATKNVKRAPIVIRRARRKTGKSEETDVAKKKIIDLTNEVGLSSLYHMTHVSNLSSILKLGILSNREAHSKGIVKTDISDPDVQRWRERRDPIHGRPLHEYAPFYVNPRNPMLYKRQALQSEICIIEIAISSLSELEYIYTDGNAASQGTRFFADIDKICELPWDVLNGPKWYDVPDGKRKMCAEFLIYPQVRADYIRCYHFNSELSLKRNKLNGVVCKCSDKLFFQR